MKLNRNLHTLGQVLLYFTGFWIVAVIGGMVAVCLFL